MRILLALAPLLVGCVHYQFSYGDERVFGGRGSRPACGRAYRDLVAATTSPPVPGLDVRRLPIDRAALHAAALRRDPAFAAWLDDDAHLQSVLIQLMPPGPLPEPMGATTDVTIWTPGGSIRLKSESFNPFEVPWIVTRGGKSYETWNADITRALDGLVRLKRRLDYRIFESEVLLNGEVAWRAER